MVTETQSSNRNLTILAIGALVLALVVVGAVLAFTLLGKGDSGQAAAAESAKLMPPETMFFLSMNPDLPAAKNFEVIRKAWGDIPEFAEVIDDWPAALFKDAEELDYQTDIGSWLGDELAFGMTGDIAELLLAGVEMSSSGVPGDVPQLGELPELPQFIIAAATTDTAASDKFLDKLRAEAEKNGTTTQETEYKGIQIVHFEPESENDYGIAYATVDGFVVLTVGGLGPMQAVIDAKDGDNLSGSDAYKKSVGALPKGSVLIGYANAGAMLEGLSGSLEQMYSELGLGVAGLAELGTANLEQAEAAQGVGFALGFDPQGIRFDFVYVYDKDALPETMLSTANPNRALEHAPADALIYVSGVDVGSALKQILEIAQAQPGAEMEDFDESMQMMEAQLGLKLDDVYAALSGEFSLAVTHSAAGLMGDTSIPIGLLLQLENKDPEVFEQLMNLAALALVGSDDGSGLETIDVNGVSVTLVNDPAGHTWLGWGLSDDFFALGTSRELIETAFDGGAKLSADATFKAATALLPKENTGYVYLNVAQTVEMIYPAMSSSDRASLDEARPVLEPIKAIGGASEPVSREKDSASGTLFILIEE
jgi:hypothetical protein